MNALDQAFAEVDVVLTSTGSPTPLVEAGAIAAALPARDGRPLLIVDLGVPRDVDPAVADLPGVTLLDMGDITAFAEAGASGRRNEVAKVEAIVAQEVDRYLAAATASAAAPLVAALRERAEGLRTAELDRHRAKLAALDDSQREEVEALTRGLVAKLLHEPTVRLKDAAGTTRGDRLAEALRALFDL
jgi:glutamyl-tRNA reductase